MGEGTLLAAGRAVHMDTSNSVAPSLTLPYLLVTHNQFKGIGASVQQFHNSVGYLSTSSHQLDSKILIWFIIQPQPLVYIPCIWNKNSSNSKKIYGYSFYQYKTMCRLSSKVDTKTEGKITVSHRGVCAVICEFRNY